MVRPGSVLEVGQLVGPVSGLQHAHAWVYTRSEEIRTFIACMDRTQCTWGLAVSGRWCVCDVMQNKCKQQYTGWTT